tara:strand:- start:614 stop:1102 length:489 start_codon:yes stop_codon:yes gene_type:complete
MDSQIETTKFIEDFSKDISGDVQSIRDKLKMNLKIIPMSDEKEEKIRWKRTASQILEDGWIVDKRCCTDAVIVFLAIAKCKDLDAKFVKLYSVKRKMFHSVVKLEDKLFDVIPNRFDDANKEVVFGEFKVYAVGEDSWDIGLKSNEDLIKVLKSGFYSFLEE